MFHDFGGGRPIYNTSSLHKRDPFGANCRFLAHLRSSFSGRLFGWRILSFLHRDAQRRRQYEQCYFATFLSYILCVCLAVLKLDVLKPCGVYSNCSIFQIYTCIFKHVTSHVQCSFPIYTIGSHTKQHTHFGGPLLAHIYMYTWSYNRDESLEYAVSWGCNPTYRGYMVSKIF